MATLIRNGRIVTSVADYLADLLIEDGCIRAIGAGLVAGPDVEVHDASGLLVLPGGVDAHTHLEMSTPRVASVDTFASGTCAAAFGGTTCVIDYCTPTPGQSLLQALQDWHGLAERACVDVGAHMVLLDAAPDTLHGMQTLVRHEGVSSFKLFMAYPGSLMVDDGAMLRALRAAGALGALTCVHAENGPAIQALIDEAVREGRLAPKFHASTRPAVLEGEAAHRAICLAELAQSPLYIVHLSTSQALDAVRRARRRGQAVAAETCPQYLFLTADAYERPGFEGAKFVMSPPLREPGHPQALWRGLKDGDLQVVATDHCAFAFEEHPHGIRYSKQQGVGNFNRIPNGAPGVETRLALMHDGAVLQQGLSLQRFVEITATAPAQLFGLYPRKGTLAVGSDGDVVLFDPAERWTVRAAEHHSLADYSLFEGRELTGRVKKVFLRGQCIVDGEQWLGRAGMGHYLPRGASGSVEALKIP
jgi:dihydropyrimidinase